MADSRSTPSAPSPGLRREVVSPRQRDGTGFYRSLALLSVTVALLAGMADAALWKSAQNRAERAKVVIVEVRGPQTADRRTRLNEVERCHERALRAAQRNEVPPALELGDELVPVELVAVEEVNP